MAGMPGSGKCIHCDKEGNLNDEKICAICRKSLKRNPNHICRSKKHEKFVCKCGSTAFHCKDMCKKCYDTSPDRYTPETIEKMRKNRLEKKPVYNRNRGEKRIQIIINQDRIDVILFVNVVVRNTIAKDTARHVPIEN